MFTREHMKLKTKNNPKSQRRRIPIWRSETYAARQLGITVAEMKRREDAFCRRVPALRADAFCRCVPARRA